MSGLKVTDDEEDNTPGYVHSDRFGVYIGSGIGGMHSFVNETAKMLKDGPQWISPLFIPTMIANIAAGNVAIAHNARGVCLPIVTACATGTHSIGEAYRAIKFGYADAIIAGGTEAAVNPLAIGGFSNSKALSPASDPMEASLPFDARRQGFVIAEGAGVVILEDMNMQWRAEQRYMLRYAVTATRAMLITIRHRVPTDQSCKSIQAGSLRSSLFGIRSAAHQHTRYRYPSE